MTSPEFQLVGADRCAMPTQHLGHCRHVPRYAYLKGSEVVYAACAQHARGAGAARMLLPRAWEFDRIYDMSAGIFLASTNLKGA